MRERPALLVAIVRKIPPYKNKSSIWTAYYFIFFIEETLIHFVHGESFVNPLQFEFVKLWFQFLQLFAYVIGKRVLSDERHRLFQRTHGLNSFVQSFEMSSMPKSVALSSCLNSFSSGG